MNIALLGYGKMGKLIEEAASSRGHCISAIIDSTTSSFDKIASADICIDFTHPDCALKNIKLVAAMGKNLVIGTTGWYDDLPQVIEMINTAGTGLLYSPNFSLGVALFLQMISHAASLIAPYPSYDVSGIEIHHNKKADAPSGTSKTIIDRLQANFPPQKDQIQFASVRVGSVPGTHSVIFDSPNDSITLTHTARNRQGFADGAVCAAEWLIDKKGVFTLEDMLSEKSYSFI